MSVEQFATVRSDTPVVADRGDQLLLRVAAFFALAVVLHNADHLRRGVDAVSRDVFWLGAAGIFVEVAVVVLICQRHRLAPLVAAVSGLSLAVGYVGVHFLPARSWASDSFTSATGVSRLSWSAASLELVAAATVAVIGYSVLSARGGVGAARAPHAGERSLRDALFHPLAFAFVISQIVVLAVSFVQL